MAIFAARIVCQVIERRIDRHLREIEAVGSTRDACRWHPVHPTPSFRRTPESSAVGSPSKKQGSTDCTPGTSMDDPPSLL